MNSHGTAQLLIGLGALLFFLGLLSGFAIPAMTNPRMGLSGHLEGVMNGTFLIAIGLAWSRCNLAPTNQAITCWLLIGAGHGGSPWQESLINIGLLSVGVTMVVSCGLLVWGFFRKP
jgi:hydroxylaminobenzene mutase